MCFKNNFLKLNNNIKNYILKFIPYQNVTSLNKKKLNTQFIFYIKKYCTLCGVCKELKKFIYYYFPNIDHSYNKYFKNHDIRKDYIFFNNLRLVDRYRNPWHTCNIQNQVYSIYTCRGILF